MAEGKHHLQVLKRMPFGTAKFIIDCCVHSEQEQSHHAQDCIGMNKLIWQDA